MHADLKLSKAFIESLEFCASEAANQLPQKPRDVLKFFDCFRKFRIFVRHAQLLGAAQHVLAKLLAFPQKLETHNPARTSFACLTIYRFESVFTLTHKPSQAAKNLRPVARSLGSRKSLPRVWDIYATLCSCYKPDRGAGREVWAPAVDLKVRKGDLTRQMIVQGALALSEKVGLEALTFGPLATQLGISKSGIFTHFKNRDELLKAVIEHAAQDFIGAVLLPSVKSPRGLPRLRKIFKRWVDYYQPGKRRIFIYNGGSGLVRELLRDVHTRWSGEVERAIQQAQEEGHLSSEVSAQQLTFELYGAALSAHHYKHVMRDVGAPARAESQFQSLLARLLLPQSK